MSSNCLHIIIKLHFAEEGKNPYNGTRIQMLQNMYKNLIKLFL